MIKYINTFPTDFERDLNVPLLNRFNDKSLLEYVIESWKSIQVLRGIEFLGYDYNDDPSLFELNKYIFKRQKGKSKNEKYDYKFIEDNKVGLLTVYLKISNLEMDFKSGKQVMKEKKIAKSMLIPLMDEEGFYFINGKKYYTIYQMVEKSTYTAANSVILKSLMPFSIRRKMIEREDMTGTLHVLPYYTVGLYSNDSPVMLVYAAHYGIDFALQFAIECAPYAVMDLVTKYDPEDKKNLYFGISTKLFLKVNKKLFNNFFYIQSVVGGFLEMCSNRLTYEKRNDTVIWIKKLSNSNIEKGKSLLMSIQRLMDETTRHVIRTDIYNKIDVLHVIRWMTQEFNPLRAKDNMDIMNKRLRCNEMIASLLTHDFSKRINSLMTLGSKVTLNDYKDIFKFSPELLIQKMHSSGIFKYDENVNDMDMWSRVKFTRKGPHSAGQKNKNSISAGYRGIHPSHIGYLDMTVCCELQHQNVVIRWTNFSNCGNCLQDNTTNLLLVTA